MAESQPKAPVLPGDLGGKVGLEPEKWNLLLFNQKQSNQPSSRDYDLGLVMKSGAVKAGTGNVCGYRGGEAAEHTTWAVQPERALERVLTSVLSISGGAQGCSMQF